MSMDIRGWGEMFPLNGPCWSLFFEYIAYVLYAFIFRKFSTRVLWWIVPLFAVGLAYVAFQGDYCNLGWGWALTKENFMIAVLFHCGIAHFTHLSPWNYQASVCYWKYCFGGIDLYAQCWWTQIQLDERHLRCLLHYMCLSFCNVYRGFCNGNKR